MKPLTLEQQLERSVWNARAKRLGRTMTQSTAIQRTDQPSAIERLVILGDLSQLGPEQRAKYYIDVCGSLGLNHLTRPFSYLRLNGKDVLYANRDCTDQLRKRDRVSVTVAGREKTDDLIIVTARATLPDGRSDEAIGAVSITGLRGENLANALMKAETKAKRRATLSICGLGFLDESELDSVNDNGGGETSITPHSSPDANPAHVDQGEYNRAMEQLKECDKDVFDRGCTWETMNKWHGRLGEKGAPGPLGKRLSEMYRGDLSERQQKALASAWARVDRKIAALKSTLKPPPVEASFTDPADGEDDGTDAFSAPPERAREPGEDDD